jgi:hypothetical protein
MQIRLVGAELFHADERTGMTRLIVAFRNFTKAPVKDRAVKTLHLGDTKPVT